MNNILQNKFILAEGSINERIRRSPIKLHPTLVNAPLIYGEHKKYMADIYRSYINIAEKAGLPIFLSTPTWRANKERVLASECKSEINVDASRFIHEIRDEYTDIQDQIKIGGLFGCKNDCYTPEVALSSKQAEDFHSWQINELAKGEVDYLICETIPALSEAVGIAHASAKTNVPYIISFVIARNGKILDGTSLAEAIQHIDSTVSVPPIGYAINCAHPSFFLPENQDKTIFKRLLAFNANASSLDHCDLENADCLHVDNIQEWGDQMLELNTQWGIKILGGCCGAGVEHIEYLAQNRIKR
uniref:homocysteine S-methyltransferase family protein n=1 Tax=uncultured Draconibacterium sp. TaxID=1573823 RepID=UPI0032177BC4